MNIHEVAKRLRKLGIPGNVKETAVKKKLVREDSVRVRKAVEK